MDIAERHGSDGRFTPVAAAGGHPGLGHPTINGGWCAPARQDRLQPLRDGLLAGRTTTSFATVHHPYGWSARPTGSGKTTTLYAGLLELRNGAINITTIEDPVEYQMGGVNQVQVNERKQVTFANSLRSFLRQDPDVIMVGEIRDRETADTAIRAALTGHMVFGDPRQRRRRPATRLVSMAPSVRPAP
jgi:hypothetical protein